MIWLPIVCQSCARCNQPHALERRPRENGTNCGNYAMRRHQSQVLLAHRTSTPRMDMCLDIREGVTVLARRRIAVRALTRIASQGVFRGPGRCLLPACSRCRRTGRVPCGTESMHDSHGEWDRTCTETHQCTSRSWSRTSSASSRPPRTVRVHVRLGSRPHEVPRRNETGRAVHRRGSWFRV